MQFQKVEASYTSKEGCRLVWKGVDEDDTDVIILNKNELESLVEIFKKNSTGEVELEDQSSFIRVNSDVTQFTLTNHRLFEAKTSEIQEQVLEFAKVPHEPQYVYVGSKEFYPSVWIRDDDEESEDIAKKIQNNPSLKQSSLQNLKKLGKIFLRLIYSGCSLLDVQLGNSLKLKLRIGKSTRFYQRQMLPPLQETFKDFRYF